jgi:hypothetical protein
VGGQTYVTEMELLSVQSDYRRKKRMSAVVVYVVSDNQLGYRPDDRGCACHVSPSLESRSSREDCQWHYPLDTLGDGCCFGWPFRIVQ